MFRLSAGTRGTVQLEGVSGARHDERFGHMEQLTAGELPPPPAHFDDVPPPADDDVYAPAAEHEAFEPYPPGQDSTPVRPAVKANSVEPLVSPDDDTALDAALLKHFGLEAFRTGQREVVKTVLAGNDAMVVMPTGAGKSLCYQLTGLLLPGLTLIISPLIALMKDQVDSLVARGLPAGLINSTQSPYERRLCMNQVALGDIKLLFVAPERFRSSQFLKMLAQVTVSLLAVDEAHCVSSWGHDFRPDYLQIATFRRELGNPRTIALTATATPLVRKDVKAQLEIPGAETFISGFERKNLYLEVYQATGKRDKLHRLSALLRHVNGPSIVYCSTRKAVSEVYDALCLEGFDAAAYHGGLDDLERRQVQEGFMSSGIDILVATNAFGMGVDKSNIRAVVHYQMPGTLEAYYQEAGRAGRDGKPSHCLFLYNYADKRTPDFFIDCSHPDKGIVSETWSTLAGMGTPTVEFDVKWLSKQMRTGYGAISTALNLLERAGHLRLPGGNSRGVAELIDSAKTKLRVDWSELAKRREAEQKKLLKVIYYATTQRCRTADLLSYFGSRQSIGSSGCGHCDVCAPAAPYAGSAPAAAPKRRRRKPAPKPQKAPVGSLRVADSAETLCRKIAAGVARGKQAHSKETVARMLIGRESDDVSRHELHQLSTFGLLSDFSYGEVVGMIAALVKSDVLVTPFGMLKMTDTALAIMKGDAKLTPQGKAAIEAAIHPKRTTG